MWTREHVQAVLVVAPSVARGAGVLLLFGFCPLWLRNLGGSPETGNDWAAYLMIGTVYGFLGGYYGKKVMLSSLARLN